MATVLYSVTALLAALLLASVGLKLTARPGVVEGYRRVGVPADRLPLLAAVLLCGAAGTVAGWNWPSLGLATTLGLVGYFVLALAAHARHRDLAHAAPPALLLLLAVAASVLYALER